jgi:hypothetical protein
MLEIGDAGSNSMLQRLGNLAVTQLSKKFSTFMKAETLL